MNISHILFPKTKDKEEFVDPIGIIIIKINDVQNIIFKKRILPLSLLKKVLLIKKINKGFNIKIVKKRYFDKIKKLSKITFKKS